MTRVSAGGLRIADTLYDFVARECLPGSGLSALIALAATSVATLHGGPQFLYAIFFGVAFNYLSSEVKT